MMTAIGETCQLNNTVTTTDVAIAIQILDNVTREVQSVGWHFNTDINCKLTKRRFTIRPSINALRMDTVIILLI